MHDGERLLQKVNQNGATSPLPAANRGWAGGDRARPRHGLGGLPELQDPARRGDQPRSIANLGTAVNTAVALGAVAVSNSYGGSESSRDPSIGARRYFNHPGRRDHRLVRRQRLRRRVPGELAVRHRGRRHVAPTSRQRARLDGDAWSTSPTKAPAAAARRTRRSRRARTTPAARAARSPTSRPSPTRPPASPSTTCYGSGGWTVFGGTSVVVADHRRRLRAGGAAAGRRVYPAQYPYANTGCAVRRDERRERHRAAGRTCARRQPGYDGPTGLGTPNGVAAFGPAPTTANDFSISVSPTSVTVAAGSSSDRDRLDGGHLGQRPVGLAERERPAERCEASFSPSTVTAGASSTLTLDTSARPRGRHVHRHDHRHRLERVAHRDPTA